MTKNILFNIIIHLITWRMPHKEAKASEYADLILLYSDNFNLDPLLVTALISRESDFHENMIGDAGELGLMQIKRHTPASKGYDKRGRRAILKADLNIYLGTRFLSRNRLYCNSDVMNYYLSAYNGWRRKHGHCYKTEYSRKVLKTYRQLKRMENELNNL